MSWVGSFLSRAELETPHVTNHCCGIERLLQRKNNNETSRKEENLLANFGQIRIWMAIQPSEDQVIVAEIPNPNYIF